MPGQRQAEAPPLPSGREGLVAVLLLMGLGGVDRANGARPAGAVVVESWSRTVLTSAGGRAPATIRSVPPEPRISTGEAAGILSVSERQVRRMIRSGVLDGQPVGRVWTLDPGRVREMAEVRRGRNRDSRAA